MTINQTEQLKINKINLLLTLKSNARTCTVLLFLNCKSQSTIYSRLKEKEKHNACKHHSFSTIIDAESDVFDGMLICLLSCLIFVFVCMYVYATFFLMINVIPILQMEKLSIYLSYLHLCLCRVRQMCCKHTISRHNCELKWCNYVNSLCLSACQYYVL